MTITLTKVARLGPCDFEFTVDWDGAPERYAFRCDPGDPMTPISWNRPLERELAEEFEALRGLNKVAGRVCREEEITLPLEWG
jgi:hypothetical protein